MKRLLSGFLIFCFAFGFASCSGGMSAPEHALIALKTLDLDAFSACMTEDCELSMSRIQALNTDITEEERETLRALYGLLHYTVENESEAKNGMKTITMKVKLPDFSRVRTLAEKKILVSAETANVVISQMLENGEIANYYMSEKTWNIMVKEENGEWKIAYTDKSNEDFVSGLYLVEMLTFFAQH